MTSTTRRSRRCALVLVLAATIPLVACQRAGPMQRADGWERPEPFGVTSAAGERHDAGLQGRLPLTGDGATPLSSGSFGAQTPVVSLADRTAWHSGTAAAGTVAPPELPAAGGHGAQFRSTTPPAESATSRPYSRLTDHPLDNPTAADLLDHWGHRRVQGLVEGLSLRSPGPETEAAGTQALQPRDLTGAGSLPAGKLEDGEEVRLLGARHGVTYGRWTGGPADTLSIEFDLSRAGPLMRDDPAFLAMLERAGKSWSHRIADTLPAWERAPGDLKGWLWNDATVESRVYVGPEGETSARFEIGVKDNDLAGNTAGRGGGSWNRRFGHVQMDREYLGRAGERSLMGVLAHEIGHVIGAWTTGDDPPEHIESLIDREAGTWNGPNVVALHGGPAPFQDESDPFAWVNGERSPYASEIDFNHSGVCSSLMAYCRRRDPRPSILPHAIDFAFLADIGLPVTEETTRPETYGLAGWTDHAGFSLSVSRDLRFHLPDWDVRNNHGAWFDAALDVTDRLRVEVDTFGVPSFGDLLQSFPAADLQVRGTVRYAGGLLGAALGRTGLPPVTGSSSLAVDLGTFGGTASFTSLAVHADGVSEPFAGGALHYTFALGGNAIFGTGTGATLLADFYGPRHEDVAGTLHDPDAGLLASFGAAHDDRPAREDVVAAADHLSGLAWRSGSAVEAENGWSEYLCGAECRGRDEVSGQWGEWTAETRASVLAATAGWGFRDAARPYADRDFVRIARQAAPSAVGGPDAADGYTGTLEHGAFGTGFETYADPRGELATDVVEVWTGIQGAGSGGVPTGSAWWSGRMVGYWHRHAAGDDPIVEEQASLAPSPPESELDVAGGDPFVEGQASLVLSLPERVLDVAFSGVASLDGRHRLDDFGFEDVAMHDDGTFAYDADSDALRGALFGPAHEEAAGAFHHDPTQVTGSFGAVRLPDPAPAEEDSFSATRPPTVDLDGVLYVGAAVAPEPDTLVPGRERNGVAVSSGEVQDGESAERVAEYLAQLVDDRSGSRTAGLPTLSEAPIVRLAEGTSEELAAWVEHTIQLINTALPAGKRIVLSPEPAPPLTALADVPEGQVFIDFAPSKDDWALGGRYKYTWDDRDGIPLMVAEVDPTSERVHAARRWEFTGMRAGRIWFDRERLETHLNTVRTWEWDADRNEWRDEPRKELRESRPDESDTVRHDYSDGYVTRMTLYALLPTLGLLRRVDSADFPESFLQDESLPRIRHLPGIDADALFAAYARLAPGILPEDLSPESLGPWEDTSFHLRGDLDFVDGAAAFGVAFRNDLARPWAAGPTPLADLGNNSTLFGTASWNGALLGVTPAAETVAGDARLVVELSALEGQLDFTDLEHWGVQAAPGTPGGGTTWGDGDLGYAVRVEGNGFIETGGDEGEVTGGFFGPAHEAMGGVLERSDLTAGFGGVR